MTVDLKKLRRQMVESESVTPIVFKSEVIELLDRIEALEAKVVAPPAPQRCEECHQVYGHIEGCILGNKAKETADASVEHPHDLTRYPHMLSKLPPCWCAL